MIEVEDDDVYNYILGMSEDNEEDECNVFDENCEDFSESIGF